jgi:hypothetical protein
VGSAPAIPPAVESKVGRSSIIRSVDRDACRVAR